MRLGLAALCILASMAFCADAWAQLEAPNPQWSGLVSTLLLVFFFMVHEVCFEASWANWAFHLVVLGLMTAGNIIYAVYFSFTPSGSSWENWDKGQRKNNPDACSRVVTVYYILLNIIFVLMMALLKHNGKRAFITFGSDVLFQTISMYEILFTFMIPEFAAHGHGLFVTNGVAIFILIHLFGHKYGKKEVINGQQVPCVTGGMKVFLFASVVCVIAFAALEKIHHGSGASKLAAKVCEFGATFAIYGVLLLNMRAEAPTQTAEAEPYAALADGVANQGIEGQPAAVEMA